MATCGKCGKTKQTYPQKVHRVLFNNSTFKAPGDEEEVGFMYKCPFTDCGRFYEHAGAYAEHLGDHLERLGDHLVLTDKLRGPRPSLECMLCNCSFSTYKDYIAHREECHDDESLKFDIQQLYEKTTPGSAPSVDEIDVYWILMYIQLLSVRFDVELPPGYSLSLETYKHNKKGDRQNVDTQGNKNKISLMRLFFSSYKTRFDPISAEEGKRPITEQEGNLFSYLVDGT
jgi:hypothetical protein